MKTMKRVCAWMLALMLMLQGLPAAAADAAGPTEGIAAAPVGRDAEPIREDGPRSQLTADLTDGDLNTMEVTVTPWEGDYDGNPHSISVSVSGPSSYTVYYSATTPLNAANYSTAGSTVKPTGTMSGGFLTYWYVKDHTGLYEDRYDSCWSYIYPVVTYESYMGTYDGSAHSPTISVEGGATLYYSTTTLLNRENYASGTTTVPTRTDSGKTKVYFCAVSDQPGAKTFRFSSTNTNLTIKIFPKHSAVPYNGVYDGSPHAAAITAEGAATLYYSTVRSLDGSNYYIDGTTTPPTRTDVGTTTVYYAAISDDKENELTWSSGSTKITVTKASTTVSTTDYAGVYDGSAHFPSIQVDGPSGYTIYYSTTTALDASNYSTGGSTSRPTRTDSGENTVYYFVKDDTGNYTDKSGSASIKIKPVVTAAAWSGTYDGKNHSPTVSVQGAATIYYSTTEALNFGNYRSLGFDAVPNRKEEGTTTVYYIAVPDANATADTCIAGSTQIEILHHTHSFIYSVETNPTVAKAGSLKGTCTLCGDTCTIPLPNLNDTDYIRTVVSEATCTEWGTNLYTWKESSYGSYSFNQPILPLGHDYVQGVCNRCGCKQGVPDEPLPFTDVKEGAYYYIAVKWAVNRGIAAGTSATTFSPKATCTRGQVMTFLWSAAGSPEPVSAENPFTDVKPSAYYCKAVLWAVEHNIATGTSPTTFNPRGTCTRAQIVTFLWNYCGSPEPATTENPFTDVKPTSYYYKAVLWAYENDVTTGTSAYTFAPKATCTRAQVVTFLWKALT